MSVVLPDGIVMVWSPAIPLANFVQVAPTGTTTAAAELCWVTLEPLNAPIPTTVAISIVLTLWVAWIAVHDSVAPGARSGQTQPLRFGLPSGLLSVTLIFV